jgi:hypothetical protein
MQILTTTGYKNIEDCSIGEQLIAYDIYDGHEIINELLSFQWMSADLFQDLYQDTIDESGNTTSVLQQTKEDLYIDTYGNVPFYKINDTWILYGNQSIWANLNVTHVKNLQVGDTVYNGTDGDVLVTSIEEVTGIGWWRLSVSGDHSYIADNLTLHNASRYWVGGGSSSAWSAITNTNWGSASGGVNNASVPTSADDVTFDGAGVNGNTNSLISSSFTILSLNITSGYTRTMTHNTDLIVAGNLTLTTGYTISGSSRLRISAASSAINMNGKTWPNIMEFGGSVTATLNSNLTVNGGIVLVNTATLNKATTQIITTTGITMTAGYNFTSTADVYLNGGSWSGLGNYNTSIFLNGNVTIIGTVNYGTGTLTYSSGVITLTNSTLNIISNCTLNTSGIIWNNFTCTLNATITLTSNLNINGSLTNSSNAVGFNKTSSEIVTVGNGISITNGSIAGSSNIYLTGGTWSSAGIANPIQNLFFINGNITLGTFASLQNTTLTLVSGTINTSGNTLGLIGSIVLHSSLSGITWNNITTNNSPVTIGLNHSLNLSGTLSIAITTTINKTASEVINSGGLSTTTAGGFNLGGTADIYLTGGVWETDTTSYVTNNVYINGNITFGSSANPYTNIAGLLTYLSGTTSFIFGHQTRIILSSTLNTAGISFNDFAIVTAASTVTLTSDLTINGLYTQSTTGGFNETINEIVIIKGGMLMSASMTAGTADIYLRGGTWSTSGAFYVTNNLFLDGPVALSGNIYYGTNILTYNSGTISQLGTTGITLNLQTSTVNNFNKVPLSRVIITAANTITMNEFFTGTASQICQISSTGANYNITFSDSFEKIAKNVAVLGATITNRMQLLIITKYKSNFTRGTNIGVRYINQSPNGFSKKEFMVMGSTDFARPYKLVSDPNFTRQ